MVAICSFTHIADRDIAHVALVERHVVGGHFGDEIAHAEVEWNVILIK